MIYSCFDQQSGLYRYFENDKQHSINADMPVPKFARDAGRIGVPSIEAARPFPRGVKPIGKGWHARGLIVQCPGGALSGGLDDPNKIMQAAIAALLIVGGVAWLATHGGVRSG